MITVEDFNSVLKEYGGSNIYHCIDTALISQYFDFDDVKYDFCEVSRETTDTDEYTYTVKVVNSAWTGGYYILDSDNEYVDDATASYDSSTGAITIVTDNPTIKLQLYICNICTSFKFERLNFRLKGSPIIQKITTSSATGVIPHLRVYLEKLNPNYTIPTLKSSTGIFFSIKSDEKGYYIEYNGTKGVERLWDDNNHQNALYFLIKMVTSPIFFKLRQNKLILGKINPTIFKYVIPSQISIDKGIVHFNGNEMPLNLSYSSGITYRFDLDLRQYSKDTVNLKVELIPKGDFLGWTYDFISPTEYMSVMNVSGLINECAVGGASVFKLGANLTLTSDLTVSHDVDIIGNDCTIDLNGHSIIVSDGVKLELSDCSLVNGDNAIVQKADSEIECTGVTFTNCESSEYSNLGSCVYCDIDLGSLTVEDDFKTVLTDCEFYDNHSAILHGGNLIIDGCKLHNTDLDYIDKHNVALLYQTDGNATIKNSILDIDYTDTDLCTNEQSLGFAQCLFQCGTSARINNTSYNDLRDNGIELTSNATHIFAKYYYPALEKCVFTSPVLGREDKAFCYCLTGLNKIFKENVQITKASDNAENNYRKIEW